MKRKIFIVICILMTIGAWLNLFIGVSTYLSMANQTTWDAIGVIVDFFIAVCWVFVTLLWVRRRNDTLR